VQEILCLQSWQASGLVTLDGILFEQAIREGDAGGGDDDEVVRNTVNSDDEVLYHEHEQ
jgi:hypothetical protein